MSGTQWIGVAMFALTMLVIAAFIRARIAAEDRADDEHERNVLAMCGELWNVARNDGETNAAYRRRIELAMFNGGNN